MATVEFRGVEALNANLERFKVRMHRGGDEAGREQARNILQSAVSFAPLLTGELRGSGRVREVKKGLFRILFDAPHAAVVHQRHLSQAQYLRRATEQNRTEQGYAQSLRRNLR